PKGVCWAAVGTLSLAASLCSKGEKGGQPRTLVLKDGYRAGQPSAIGQTATAVLRFIRRKGTVKADQDGVSALRQGAAQLPIFSGGFPGGFEGTFQKCLRLRDRLCGRSKREVSRLDAAAHSDNADERAVQ